MSRIRKNLIIITFLLFASFVAVNFSLAQGVDTGMSFGQQIGLSNTDPRIVVANVIRIALGFLGIIAVGLIMYAGWLYMTAAGEADKIEQAKKMLINAVIGLVIILSAFGIVTFIISSMLGATGGTSAPSTGICNNDGTCDSGDGETCSSCSGDCGACAGGPTITPPGDGGEEIIPCTDSEDCEDGYYCDATSQTCVIGGEYGSACDSVSSSPSCEADDGLCSAYLKCDTGTCTCLGAPVIEWVSPMDGDKPVGAPGNLVTIGGRSFGDDPGEVNFSDPTGQLIIPASFPDTICGDTWSKNQIVVVVPDNANTGAIKVTRAEDGAEDTTSDTRGPVINDFVKDDITRPGICKIDPIEGKKNDEITYSGIGLSGGIAKFGNALSNVGGLESSFNSSAGTAKVPDIRTGQTSTFVSSAGVNSNYLDFKKNAEPYAGPKIISFEPKEGAPGQYVTIHGSGFGAVQGANKVYFGDGTPIEASYKFPEICAGSIWSDKQIIVKVPDTITAANYLITMEIGSYPKIRSSQNFTVKAGSPGPSLCKIEPIAGPINSTVNLWGEYFGDTAGSVKFNSNKSQSGTAITGWAKDISVTGVQPYKTTTTVHSDAATGDGQVKVVQGASESNGMNFKVGDCVSGGCGTGVCCPADSSEAGKCIIGTDLGVCYTVVTSSVYEWEFSTEDSGTGEEESNINVRMIDEESSEEGGGTAQFAVSLKKVPTTDVAIDLTSSDETEGKITDPIPDTVPNPDLAKLNFDTITWNIEQLVTVTGQDDTAPDGATIYYINLKAESDDANYSGKEERVELINVDDEMSGGILVSGEDDETSESGGTEKLKVRLYKAPEIGKDVVVNFASSDLTEGVITGMSSLSFSDSTYTNSQYILVTGQDDSIEDPEEDYFITPTVVSTSKNYSTMVPGDITLINTDNDSSVASRPGEKCVATITPTLTCNSSFVCGTGYGCLSSDTDTCGTCCCTPGQTFNDLTCIKNQTPCGGDNRGLFCGCETDDACGSKETVGCATDTCCRTRPTVTGVYPADDVVAKVCRNTLIFATFDQKMDISSFAKNMIVAGDYGSDNCPSGSEILSLNKIENKNIFARAYRGTIGVLKKISEAFRSDSALAGVPDKTHNYCIVPGIISGIHETAESTSITFSPSKPLAENKTYYVVIKGDENLDSNSGVLSNWGLGYNGPDSIIFKTNEYENSKSWSFKTGSDICMLNSVSIDPASSLFGKAGEEKLFTASTHSSDGQIITGLPGEYEWGWSWMSDNEEVAMVTDTNNKVQTVTSKNVKDAKTLIKATATISADTVSKTTTKGQSKTGQAEVYVFLCANPWPDATAGTWTPWRDSSSNCLGGTGDCKNTNYELYYCRDAGVDGPEGDLPAIGDTIIRGESTVQDILKETYFFRE